MPKKVTLVKAVLPTQPVELTVRYQVVDAQKFVEHLLLKLQAEVLGVGCGCRSVAQLITELSELGVEVSIEERGGSIYHGGQNPNHN